MRWLALVAAVLAGCSGDIGSSAVEDASVDAESADAALPPCPDDWFDCDFRARHPLTIDNVNGDETLTDVPILFVLSADRTDPVLLSRDSLRFVDGNGAELAHQIDSDIASGGLAAWVRIPSVAAGATEAIHVYYGNAGATDASRATDVWSNGYTGVWHMDENPGGAAPQLRDSTANDNDGTSSGDIGAAARVDGRIGSATLFDGIDDYVQIPNSTSLDISGPTITLSAWISMTNPQGNDNGVLIKSAGNQYNYQLGVEGDQAGNFRVRTDIPVDPDVNPNDNLSRIDTANVLSPTTWYHVVGVFDGSNTTVYLNGVPETTEAHTGNILSADAPLLIGRRQLGDERYFDGVIDEARVASAARSDAWVLFQYRTSEDQVVGYGAIERQSGTR